MFILFHLDSDARKTQMISNVVQGACNSSTMNTAHTMRLRDRL